MHNILKPFGNEAQIAVKKTFVSALSEREQAKMEFYLKARNYYSGSQDTKLTDRARQFLNVDSDADFSVNYMPMVVDAKADRLKVIGFDIPKDESQKEILTDWWRKNRMDSKQGIVHSAVGRDGDSFVLVEWDEKADMPRYHYEPAYAGEGVMVYYSDERRDEIEFASKHWQIKHGRETGEVSRLNLYFPKRIEKYIADTKTSVDWLPFEDDDTDIIADGHLGLAGISWWTDNGKEDGEPLGMPIIHFKNKDTGDFYGTSDLEKVMPLQDAVNKAMIDLLIAMDIAGFGTYVGTGSGLDWTVMLLGAGAIQSTGQAPEAATLEKLPADNPDGLLNTYNALVQEVFRVSGTPLSYVQSSGQIAAEGTMKQQEVALVTQVEKSQTDHGNKWEDCMIMGRRLHNAFSNSKIKLDETMVIDTLWKEAESRNDEVQAKTLAIKVGALGVSKGQAQTEMGYTAIQKGQFERAELRLQAQGIRNGAKAQTAQEQDSAQDLTQTENEASENGATESTT